MKDEVEILRKQLACKELIIELNCEQIDKLNKRIAIQEVYISDLTNK